MPTSSRAGRLGASTVALNGAISVGQMAITTLITFITTRELVGTLGDPGNPRWGVLTALGASGVYSTILLSGLTSASMRHLAHEVGADDDEALSSTFASTVALFSVVAVGLGVVGLLLEPVIINGLTIPEDLRDAGRIIYLATVAQLAFGAFAAPFGAMRQAHQRFGAIAVYALAARVMILIGLLVFLDRVDNRLLFAGLLIASANALTDLAVVSHTLIQFFGTLTRGLRLISLHQIKRVLGFAQWTGLSALTMQMRSQISIVLLNVAFDANVNGAYATADRTANMSMQFGGGLNRSLQAAITSAYSAGNTQRAKQIISSGSRYPAYAILPVFVVMMLDARGVLDVWLTAGKYEPQTATFARLLVAAVGILLLTAGYSLSLYGLNRPRTLLLRVLPFDVAAFVIGLIAVLQFGASAVFFTWMFLANSILQVVIRPFLFGEIADYRAPEYLRGIVMPVLRVAAVSFAAAAIPWLLLDSGFVRVAAMGILAGLGTVVGAWFLGTEPEERALAKSTITSRLNR